MTGANVGSYHAWLMENVFFTGDDNESILSIDRSGVRNGLPVEARLVFRRSDVSPEHYNLLRTSPMLYQQLTYQYGVLQSLLDALEGKPGTERMQHILTDAQNSIMLTQRAAVEGIEKVAAELDRQEPTGNVPR